MDFAQLEMFINVVSLKSFTKAAESLYLSQPTISARIKSLEDELGVVLLDRSRSREFSLTEAGILFWDYAQKVLNEHQGFMGKFSNTGTDMKGYVSIGCSSVPGIYILPEILAGFSNQFEQVKIGVKISDSSDIIADIVNYVYDFGIVGYRENDRRLVFTPFSEDEMILVTAPGLLKKCELADNGEIPLELITPHKLILREPGSATRRVFEQHLTKAGYTMDVFQSILILNSLEAIKQAVRHGLGVSVMSGLSVNDYISIGLLDGYRLKKMKLARTFYLVHHRHRVGSTAAKVLINYIGHQSKGESNGEINPQKGGEQE